MPRAAGPEVNWTGGEKAGVRFGGKSHQKEESGKICLRGEKSISNEKKNFLAGRSSTVWVKTESVAEKRKIISSQNVSPQEGRGSRQHIPELAMVTRHRSIKSPGGNSHREERDKEVGSCWMSARRVLSPRIGGNRLRLLRIARDLSRTKRTPPGISTSPKFSF